MIRVAIVSILFCTAYYQSGCVGWAAEKTTNKMVRRCAKPDNSGEEYSLGYTKVGQQIFFDEKAIQVDPGTFCVLVPDKPDFIGYGKDSNHVYYKGNAIKDADAATFKLVWGGIGKDAKHLFVLDQQVEVDDIESFKILSSVMGDSSRLVSTTKNSVYTIILQPQAGYGGRVNFSKLVGADPAAFQVCRGNPCARYPSSAECKSEYAKDAKKVYFFDIQREAFKVIEGADPKTFQVANSGFDQVPWAADKRRVYRRDEVQKLIDADSFQVITSTYVKDKNRVYCDGLPLAGSDPDTFGIVMDGDFDALDEHHRYRKCQVVGDR